VVNTVLVPVTVADPLVIAIVPAGIVFSGQ